MKKVSTARAKQLREYAKLKREFLHDHAFCFSCEIIVPLEFRELHHICGRVGRLLCWEPGFRMACKGCHHLIHAMPDLAFKKGMFGPRECWNDFRRAVAWHNQKDTK